MGTLFCMHCASPIDYNDEFCRQCGAKNEYRINTNNILRTQKTKKRSKEIFSDTERLALGLYPKDEGYKMSLITKILYEDNEK